MNKLSILPLILVCVLNNQLINDYLLFIDYIFLTFVSDLNIIKLLK
jgi:hypothetical protein